MDRRWHASVDLPPNQLAAGAVRRLIVGLLQAWRHESCLDDALLVATELVTNAVRYTAEDGTLHLDVVGDDRSLRLVLSDPSSDFPVVGEPAPHGGELAESGRGMHIVERLTASWGVSPLPSDGKQVWAELR